MNHHQLKKEKGKREKHQNTVTNFVTWSTPPFEKDGDMCRVSFPIHTGMCCYTLNFYTKMCCVHNFNTESCYYVLLLKRSQCHLVTFSDRRVAKKA